MPLLRSGEARTPVISTGSRAHRPVASRSPVASRPADASRSSGVTRSTGFRVAAPLVLAAALGLALAGCTPEATPSPAPTTQAAAPTPTATPTAAPAAYDPNAGAEANKPAFDQVNQGVIAANSAAGGADFVLALRAAGFDSGAMQLTPDITTVGVKADSVQFSVRLSDGCLVGQYGQGTYESQVMPALGTGACLIGQTRPIDF
jgi:hypothetical protein